MSVCTHIFHLFCFWPMFIDMNELRNYYSHWFFIPSVCWISHISSAQFNTLLARVSKLVMFSHTFFCMSHLFHQNTADLFYSFYCSTICVWLNCVHQSLMLTIIWDFQCSTTWWSYNLPNQLAVWQEKV